MLDDAQLLQRYLEERSQAAFAELVQRHLNLVYFAALRQIGDPHTAKDVTQNVFLKLALKARALAGRPTVAGWLFKTTRFEVAHCPGDGFAVYVFSSRHRFLGFWEAIPFFTDDNDRLSQACATDLPGKLCGIAVRGRYDDVQQWVDLRSKRAGK